MTTKTCDNTNAMQQNKNDSNTTTIIFIVNSSWRWRRLEPLCKRQAPKKLIATYKHNHTIKQCKNTLSINTLQKTSRTFSVVNR